MHIRPKLAWATAGTDAAKKIVINDDNTDWSGYANLIEMRNISGRSDVVDGEIFPAAYACETYAESDSRMVPLVNTSGWFLPTYSMLDYLMTDNMDSAFKAIAQYAGLDQYKGLFDSNTSGYWSSTENQRFPNQAYCKLRGSSTNTSSKIDVKFVRAVLAF